MKKKVLFCATVDYHFKAFHLPYLKWFKEQGWQVDVAASGEIDLPYIDNKHNIPIQRSPLNKENVTAYKQLKSIIKENKYQLIHCHTPMGGVLARLVARQVRKQGTKVIYTAHGFHFCKGSPMTNWLLYYPIEKSMARYTDCLITINEEDYQLATKRFNIKHIEHVHGVGINTEQFSPVDKEKKIEMKKSFGYQADDFLLFYAAEFNKNKNQQFLLQSLALVKEEMPNAKLLLAGEGAMLESSRKLTRNLGISKMVDFLGCRPDIDQIVPMCDIAVASSLREGLPVNVMEAMACGLPVVAVDNRGHRELIKDNETGFLITPNDRDRCARKLLALYLFEELRTKLGAAGREVIANYAIPQVSKELSSIYSRYMLEANYESKDKYYRARI